MKKPKSGLLHFLFSTLNKEVQKEVQKLEKAPEGKVYNRRKFITQTSKGALGAAIALSLPSFLTSCKEDKKESSNTGKTSTTKKNEMLDLAILGGGMAGLNCANYLLQSNINYKIFEANKRVGGRILTHYNDALGLGIFPEFGGDFIDTNHEDMLNLAKEFNLELLDLVAEQQSKKLEKDVYFFEGQKRSEAAIIKEFKKIANKLAKDKISLGENYDTPEAIKLDNTALATYIYSLPCANWLKELLVAAFIAEYGLDCEEQSTINMLDMIDTDTSEGFKVFGESDERYRIKGGNSKIIEGLEKKIGSEKIMKNYEVESIIENEDSTYTINFKNQEKVVAKAIVCTIPFTILRTINLKLKNMSAEKRKCIDELGYGMNTKVLLGYNGTPWTAAPNNAMGYLFHKDIVNGWDSSYNKTEGNTNGAFVGYFGGKYSMMLNEKSFKNAIAPPWHVWKTELPKETVQGFVNELDKVFKGSKEKFLDKHVFINWIDFPYSKGSYTCFKVGQWTSIAGLEMQPVDNFFFAGEHCSEDFQGFMNGAAETGRRVASIVVEKLQQKKA